MSELLRAPAEIKYAEELDWLESIDDNPKPFSWRLSPKMVRLFILGSERADGLDREISQKWFGDRSFVERSIVTRLRPWPAADRRPRHGQELAGRAAVGGDLP